MDVEYIKRKKSMNDLEFSWFPLERWQSICIYWGIRDSPYQFFYKDYFDGWWVCFNFKLFSIQLSERP